MKASKLIDILNDAIKKHGDLNIGVVHDYLIEFSQYKIDIDIANSNDLDRPDEKILIIYASYKNNN